jgi:hypothetical protein
MQVTLEDDGRPLSQPRLPFSVYGSIAMARTEEVVDSGSSQVRIYTEALVLTRGPSRVSCPCMHDNAVQRV